MRRSSLTALALLASWASQTLAVALASATAPDLNCVILPDEQVEVSSAVPGVIEAVLVRRSDRVGEGHAAEDQQRDVRPGGPVHPEQHPADQHMYSIILRNI